jgi:hypothetical protein
MGVHSRSMSHSEAIIDRHRVAGLSLLVTARTLHIGRAAAAKRAIVG